MKITEDVHENKDASIRPQTRCRHPVKQRQTPKELVLNSGWAA